MNSLASSEIKLQSELGEGHTNIVTPEEVMLTSHYLGLVMEFAPGGSLTGYITQKFRECRGVGLLVQEDEARYFFKQIVAAVDYCHKHHVSACSNDPPGIRQQAALHNAHSLL